MKVAIIGTRGIPAAYGGFETFAFRLSAGLAEAGIDITVVNEKSHVCTIPLAKNIQVVHSNYDKSTNPLQFYRDSLRMTENEHDIVLVCGVGGAFFYPNKNARAIIITNVDGLEHLRKKYTFLQRRLVYMLQRIANKRSDYLIADSKEVESYWKKRFANSSEKLRSISYGADLISQANESLLQKFGIEAENYFLVIARLVPENNIEMIINGFKMSGSRRKLVILGDTNDNPYSRDVAKMASDSIIFAGAIYDEEIVRALRFHAFAYLHGHSVGGTNPSLVEAMAASCACVCFKTVFNSEVTNDKQLSFISSDELSAQLNLLESNETLRKRMKKDAFELAKNNYSWEGITTSYITLFNKLLGERR
ncbi:MAG: DUF1972 domain-containing protein [Bacteroidetes bacterium]|nr:DUF1972 domain-containing protein [Bacteroidota bacterium]